MAKIAPAAAASTASTPEPRPTRGGKPINKATARQRRRAVLLGLLVAAGYLAIMQPQQVERFTRMFGAHATGLSNSAGNFSLQGATPPANLPTTAINADVGALAELVEKDGSSKSGGIGELIADRPRLNLETFWSRRKSAAAGDSDFTVKAVLKSKRGATEPVWIRVVAQDGAMVSGLLASEPRDLDGLRAGTRVTFDTSSITAWKYLSNGRIVASPAER